MVAHFWASIDKKLHPSSNSKISNDDDVKHEVTYEVIYEVIMMKFKIERKSSLERSGAQNLAHS